MTKSYVEIASLLGIKSIYPARPVTKGILYNYIRQMNPIMAITGVS